MVEIDQSIFHSCNQALKDGTGQKVLSPGAAQHGVAKATLMLRKDTTQLETMAKDASSSAA